MPFNHGSRRASFIILLLCALLAIVCSSPIDPVSSLAATSAITTTPSADLKPTSTTVSSISSSTSNEPESAPSTTCTTMPSPTCTPSPSCTASSSSFITSNLPLPLPALIGIGAAILVLALITFAALYFWRRRQRSSSCARAPAVSDEELLQTWATHGAGRMMLANHYGVTNPHFSGNPWDIPPGEFVVRQTGSWAEMLDVWARVNGVVKPVRGAAAAAADGAGYGLLAGRMK